MKTPEGPISKEHISPPSSKIEEQKFNIVGKSRIGSKHKEGGKPNEDTFFVSPDKSACAVLDGVGGELAGNIASSMARDHINKKLVLLLGNLSEEETIAEIKKIVSETHGLLLDMGRKDPSSRGMATTLSLVKFWKGKDATGKNTQKAIIAQMGDSRVYILRKNKRTLEQLTLDNTVLMDLLKESKSEDELRELQLKASNDRSQLSKEERDYFKGEMANALSNGLGGREDAWAFSGVPNISSTEINEGDIILLVSDGVCKEYTDSQIVQIMLEEKAPEAIASRLVSEDFDPDDKTAVVAQALAA